MAGMLETYGNTIEDAVSGLANSMSSVVMEKITPVVVTGLTIYFIVKGWQYLCGRERPGALMGDLVFSFARIALVAYFALQTTGYINYVIGAAEGLESTLVSVVTYTMGSSSPTPWAVIDTLWLNSWNALSGVWDFSAKLGWLDRLLVSLFLLATMFATLLMTLSAAAVLLASEIGLTLVLAFGPLFVSLLMFPAARDFFTGWLKTALSLVLTVVFLTATLLVVNDVVLKQVSTMKTGLSARFYVTEKAASEAAKKSISELAADAETKNLTGTDYEEALEARIQENVPLETAKASADAKDLLKAAGIVDGSLPSLFMQVCNLVLTLLLSLSVVRLVPQVAGRLAGSIGMAVPAAAQALALPGAMFGAGMTAFAAGRKLLGSGAAIGAGVMAAGASAAGAVSGGISGHRVGRGAVAVMHAARWLNGEPASGSPRGSLTGVIGSAASMGQFGRIERRFDAEKHLEDAQKAASWDRFGLGEEGREKPFGELPPGYAAEREQKENDRAARVMRKARQEERWQKAEERRERQDAERREQAAVREARFQQAEERRRQQDETREARYRQAEERRAAQDAERKEQAAVREERFQAAEERRRKQDEVREARYQEAEARRERQDIERKEQAAVREERFQAAEERRQKQEEIREARYQEAEERRIRRDEERRQQESVREARYLQAETRRLEQETERRGRQAVQESRWQAAEERRQAQESARQESAARGELLAAARLQDLANRWYYDHGSDAGNPYGSYVPNPLQDAKAWQSETRQADAWDRANPGREYDNPFRALRDRTFPQWVDGIPPEDLTAGTASDIAAFAAAAPAPGDYAGYESLSDAEKTGLFEARVSAAEAAAKGTFRWAEAAPGEALNLIEAGQVPVISFAGDAGSMTAEELRVVTKHGWVDADEKGGS